MALSEELLRELSKPETPYVYFDDIDSELFNSVADYFYQDIEDFKNPDTGLSAIESAFNFLQAVIYSERSKEEAFLAYLKGETQDTLNIDIPSLNSNWKEFVQTIQTKLDFGKNGMTDLQNEADRLHKNINNYTQAVNKDFVHYAESSLQQTSNKLKKLLNDLKTRQMNSETKTLITSIINNFKKELLEANNGTLILNEDALRGLILILSHEITKQYTSKEYSQNKTKKEHNFSTTNLDALLADDEIHDNINNFIRRFKSDPVFKQNMLNNYGISISPNKPYKRIELKKIVTNGDIYSTNSDTLVKNLFEQINNYEVPREAFKIIQTTNILAEVESGLNQAMSKAFYVKNTGASKAKPDNIIGYITVDLDSIDVSQDSKVKSITSEIIKIERELDELVSNLKQTNTTTYYQEQANKWKATSDKIQQLLDKISQLSGKLIKCFIIEDSTKNYLSLYAREEDGSLSNGVHGGSLGAKLDDQLNKIEQLSSAGHITMIDKAWLTSAIINSGQHMIAYDQKNKLENYLSMFAAILLFDSQVNIAEEAYQFFIKQLPHTNVHQIHLFSVNGGYYPLSYVLKLTYDSLNMHLTRIISDDIISNGVETEIYGYVSKPDGYGLQAWKDTAELAKNQTKVKMKFLVNFLNVLENLLPSKNM